MVKLDHGKWSAQQEQHRNAAIARLGLLTTPAVPIFDEAVQMVAQFLDVPVVWFGVPQGGQLRLLAVTGLHHFGTMNDWARSRSMNYLNSENAQVLEQGQSLALETLAPESPLAQRGGQSFLGVPVGDRHQIHIGVFSIVSLTPRSFTPKDIAFVEMAARWSMQEYELQYQSSGAIVNTTPPDPLPNTLLQHLIYELRTPLTSVLGMARVLGQELYGPLGDKQKEYVTVISQSGEQLLDLIGEMVKLGEFITDPRDLVLESVPLEPLFQQLLTQLEPLARGAGQTLELHLRPEPAPWFLDRSKISQALYYLLHCLMQSTAPGRKITITVLAGQGLEILIQVVPPLLEDAPMDLDIEAIFGDHPDLLAGLQNTMGAIALLQNFQRESQPAKPWSVRIREVYGLVLSCRMIEAHGGRITVTDTSPCYRVQLPRLMPPSTPPG